MGDTPGRRATLVADGVVVDCDTLPGGSEVSFSSNEPDGVLSYNSGDNAVHFGDWLGLLHTFEGDVRAGRPRQRYAGRSRRCVLLGKRQLHQNDPGVDPIHNFMDFTDDDCIDRFTAASRLGWTLSGLSSGLLMIPRLGTEFGR